MNVDVGRKYLDSLSIRFHLVASRLCRSSELSDATTGAIGPLGHALLNHYFTGANLNANSMIALDVHQQL